MGNPIAKAVALPVCQYSESNSSLLFYNERTGSAITGILSSGKWQQKNMLTLPVGYTHAAASRDSLLLYNANRGTAETGTFKAGQYTRVNIYNTFNPGWHSVTATGDSALFYNKDNGHAGTGILWGGKYQHVRSYADFRVGWSSIAGSCDTMCFSRSWWKEIGKLEGGELAYGTLTYGLYKHVGNVPLPDGVWYAEGNWSAGGNLSAMAGTKDSLFGWWTLNATTNEQCFVVATAKDGKVGPLQTLGNTPGWHKVGRTADSLVFYKSDGVTATAYTATLTSGKYANVGPITNIQPGYSLIAGGV
ncbi:hypothetical protein [Streptomyces sp. Tu 3180]|uniref:hypothetical protein n=1 Tax=Streptomyces sp. Tu 3180 TaxID=2682611 RepID=UPI001357E80A|nr:hypothetical protein [Streptomyces sp. Tu 3180]KAF3470084.1 hypothetical protein GL259_00895 [Streptomyces sp. Tu 3180]